MKEELMLFAGKAIIIAITVLIVLFIIDDAEINWLLGNFFDEGDYFRQVR